MDLNAKSYAGKFAEKLSFNYLTNSCNLFKIFKIKAWVLHRLPSRSQSCVVPEITNFHAISARIALKLTFLNHKISSILPPGPNQHRNPNTRYSKNPQPFHHRSFHHSLKNSYIAFESFALGNGSSGTGQFRILQGGSQPSLKLKSFSGGTTLRTYASWRSRSSETMSARDSP